MDDDHYTIIVEDPNWYEKERAALFAALSQPPKSETTIAYPCEVFEMSGMRFIEKTK